MIMDGAVYIYRFLVSESVDFLCIGMVIIYTDGDDMPITFNSFKSHVYVHTCTYNVHVMQSLSQTTT